VQSFPKGESKKKKEREKEEGEKTFLERKEKTTSTLKKVTLIK